MPTDNPQFKYEPAPLLDDALTQIYHAAKNHVHSGIPLEVLREHISKVRSNGSFAFVAQATRAVLLGVNRGATFRQGSEANEEDVARREYHAGAHGELLSHIIKITRETVGGVNANTADFDKHFIFGLPKPIPYYVGSEHTSYISVKTTRKTTSRFISQSTGLFEFTSRHSLTPEECFAKINFRSFASMQDMNPTQDHMPPATETALSSELIWISDANLKEEQKVVLASAERALLKFMRAYNPDAVHLYKPSATPERPAKKQKIGAAEEPHLA